MSPRMTFALITSLITFSLIFEPVPVHGESENANKTETKFVCEQVVTNIDKCDKTKCETKGVNMLKKCDPSYVRNEAIKRKCEESHTNENKSQNLFLTIPVISTAKNTVYWNMYCALCNDVDEFEFGDPLMLHVTIEECGFSIFGNFKFALTESILNKYLNVLCAGKTSRLIEEDILKSDNYCSGKSLDSEPPLYSYVASEYCDIHPLMRRCPELPFREDLYCTYGSELGHFCTYDAFLFEGVNFAYGENGNVYVSSSPTYHPSNKFLPNEYVNLTDRKGVIYVCGGEVPSVLPFSKIALFLSYSVSVVFYILCIILKSNKQSLRNLPNRTVYSLCITLLMYSFVQLHIQFPTIDGSCIVAEFAYAFLSMSSLLWTLVIFYEHSRVIYYSIRKLEMPTEELLTKKYLIYCSVCWILPLIPTVFTSILISLTHDPDKSSSCPKLGKYSVFYCGLDKDSHEYASTLFTIDDTLQLICTIIFTVGFFGVVLTMVYLRWQNSDTSNERKYPIVFEKNALTCIVVTFHYVFYLLSQFSNSFEDFFLVLFDICDGLLGILIFFVCYYEKEMLSNFRVWYNLRKGSLEKEGIYEQEDDDVSQSSRN